MSIRIDVQMEHASESMRFVATATLDGKRLHEVGKHGGTEACDEVFAQMVEWLKGQGYAAPDHYWQQTFPRRT